MAGFTWILWSLLLASENSANLPRLSFDFFDPLHGKTIKPQDDWIVAGRDKAITFHVLLETESVDAQYEGLVFRDSKGPDPLLVGSKRPQSMWLEVFRLDEDGRRAESGVPTLTHYSGGGKSLRVYSATITLHILFSEPERSRRTEAMIDRLMEATGRTLVGDADAVEKQREMFRRQIAQHAVDMPPGDYEVEARYAPNVVGMWRGELRAVARIRVGEENDPLSKVLDGSEGKR